MKKIMNKKSSRFLISIVLMLSFFTISACSIQKQNIVQGSLLDSENLKELSIGMSKDQVRVILGSPALIDAFSPNQWIYYHSKTRIDKNQPQQIGKLILTFNGSNLYKITGGEKLIAPKSNKNLQGNTIITKPTQKKRGIFNR